MRRLNLIFALALLALTGVAHAQSSNRELADANRTAMDAYNNLDIEAAKSTLEQAIASAESNGLTGSGLARTYTNLGVVEIGGFSDAAAALDAFVKALHEDASVEPDPLVSTPEVLQVFAQAKRKAGQGGGGRSRPAPTPPPPAVVEGNLEHVPAAEQLVNTPIPVFVAATDPELASAKIFWRSVGMKQPKSSQMQHSDEGFTFTIPCDDVFAPTVEYFVIAFDADGKKLGNAGTPENPVAIPIVRTRSQPAPSLPNQVPPSQCGKGGAAAAASTSFAEPSSASSSSSSSSSSYGSSKEGALGDTCGSDSDCGEGLTCLDNFCAFGKRDEDEDDADDGDQAPFYFDLGFGVGMAYVKSGMKADAPPPQGLANQGAQQGTTDKAAAFVAKSGWDCKVAQPQANGGFQYDSCKVLVDTPGFVAMPVLTAAAGYHITPSFGIAAIGRFQFGHGVGSVGLSGGLRADLQLTEPSATGFKFGLLGGFLIGPIQAQPPKKAGSSVGPYATSGIFGIQAGARMGYMFTRNFGLVVTPAVNMMLGNFMFDLDLTGGATVAF